MTTTLAPSDEACLALVDRINTGTDYVLDVDATHSPTFNDPLEEFDGLRVDLVHDTQVGQSDRLDGLDQSKHTIRVWVRKKLSEESKLEETQDLNLLRTQILSRIDNWDSSDRRVQVWDTENEDLELPVKDAARKLGLFIACIILHVEVMP